MGVGGVGVVLLLLGNSEWDGWTFMYCTVLT